MKRNAFFRKLNVLIALGGVSAALIFYGCSNLLSSANDAPANFAQPKEGYGIVSGNLPSSNSATARTAMPSSIPTPTSYKVFARNGSQKIDANVDNAAKTFSIALPFGNWDVTANGLDAGGRTIFTQTKQVTLDASNPNESLDFKLGYSTNPDDGDGEISLSVSFPPKDSASNPISAITGIEYILSKGEEKIIRNVSNADLTSGKFQIEHTTENLGAWNLTIRFYGDFSNLVYRIDQTVNIYANLTTDTFEGSAPYISDGDIVLTQDLLEDFQNTTLYVNATSGKDTNTGTQFDPLQTFNRAVELVNNSSRSADTEFRIFLQTDVADGATLALNARKRLTVASAGNTAHTITSLGRTFTVADGSDLTAKYINFTNLGFTVEGTLEMDNCFINGGNSAGGVYVNGDGIFTMNGGEIKDCHSDMYGGGICIQQGTTELTSTKIIGCSANMGGAVFIANTSSTFTMKDCTISGNSASSNGGGVCAYNGNFTMEGGTFSGNKATKGKGAYVYPGCTFAMSGAAKFEDDNDIYLTADATIQVAGSLSEEKVATITPSNYAAGRQVLSAGTGITITKEICNQFAVTPESESNDTEWTIAPSGNTGVLSTKMDAYYVRGDDAPWYTANAPTATADDDNNSGSRLSPFATIQKAIGKVITDNDGSSEYTIYVDGTLTREKVNNTYSGMADFSALTENLTLTIKSMSEKEGEKATLNANENARVIYAAMPNNASDPNVSLSLTLENLVITQANASDQNGGGIYFNSSGGSLTMKGCIVKDNKSLNGGGIYFDSTNSKFTMEKCEIIGNDSAWYGGGIYNKSESFIMTDCTISNNHTSEQWSKGGGIYNAGTFTMKDGTISGNTSKGDGGGVSIAIENPTIDNSKDLKFTLESGTISGNEAIFGGGVHINDGGTFTMSDGTIKENTATITGNGSSGGGGVHIYNGTFTMSGGEISKNEATGTTEDSGGGGIYVGTNGTVTLKSNAKVINNTATANGGGIYNNGVFEIKNAEVSKNTAEKGGGVYNKGTLEIEGTISGNTAASGAGIHSAGGRITLKSGAKVINNINGCGICATDNFDKTTHTTLTMEEGAEVSGHRNMAHGGGILVNNKSTFTMNGGTISDNKSGVDKDNKYNDYSMGGGVYIGMGGTFTMTKGMISNNTAENGGGVYINTGSGGLGTFTMTGGTITSNTANSNGGGVFVGTGSNCDYDDISRISGNTPNEVYPPQP